VGHSDLPQAIYSYIQIGVCSTGKTENDVKNDGMTNLLISTSVPSIIRKPEKQFHKNVTEIGWRVSFRDSTDRATFFLLLIFQN
jgi:hypothetical protein